MSTATASLVSARCSTAQDYSEDDAIRGCLWATLLCAYWLGILHVAAQVGLAQAASTLDFVQLFMCAVAVKLLEVMIGVTVLGGMLRMGVLIWRTAAGKRDMVTVRINLLAVVAGMIVSAWALLDVGSRGLHLAVEWSFAQLFVGFDPALTGMSADARVSLGLLMLLLVSALVIAAPMVAMYGLATEDGASSTAVRFGRHVACCALGAIALSALAAFITL